MTHIQSLCSREYVACHHIATYTSQMTDDPTFHLAYCAFNSIHKNAFNIHKSILYEGNPTTMKPRRLCIIYAYYLQTSDAI